MTALIICTFLAVVLILLCGYLISLYNTLIKLRNEAKKYWANIDVLLKQRHDELPKLIDSCKTYMSYESKVLQEVTNARTQAESARASGDLASITQSETVVKKSLMNLMAVAENYPDLKASNSFQQLQQQIAELENQIADRRELYNQGVAIFNSNIQEFPGVLIAQKFAFTALDMLQFEAAEKADVDVADAFGAKASA